MHLVEYTSWLLQLTYVRIYVSELFMFLPLVNTLDRKLYVYFDTVSKINISFQSLVRMFLNAYKLFIMKHPNSHDGTVKLFYPDPSGYRIHVHYRRGMQWYKHTITTYQFLFCQTGVLMLTLTFLSYTYRFTGKDVIMCMVVAHSRSHSGNTFIVKHNSDHWLLQLT